MSAVAVLGRARAARDRLAAWPADPQPWGHLVRHDPAQRVFECLRLDDQLEIWLICWMPGHDTGFHDHDLSSGAVVVAQGAVVEERLRAGRPARAPPLRAGRRLRLLACRHPPRDPRRQTPATTLHAYSPPLRRMGAYLVQPGGTLERHPLAKDEELRPLTSAA